MEPPVINDPTFSSANPSSYSLSEIWPITPPPFPHHPSTLTTTKRKHSTSAATPHLLDHSHYCANKHIKLGASPPEANSKVEADESSVRGNKSAPPQGGGKPCSEPPAKQDYIHVRARRGQATDSHSLAERARREKISERMKILQDIVPGCNKVIGKALVLDEIINYILSLQRQVEFLSLKLEAVNSRLNMNPTIECFPSKDVGTQPFDLAGMIFGSQATRGYAQGSQTGWLHMQLGGVFERAT